MQTQARMRDRPAWQQTFVAIVPWLLIRSTVLATATVVLSYGWTTEAIATAVWGLPIVLSSAENLSVNSRNYQD